MRSIIRMPALVRLLLVLVTVEVTSVGLTAAPEHDPLPSWKDGQSKAAIMTFVARVTDEKSSGGIPPEQVVGSELDARFEMRDGIPTIVKTPNLLFVDDKAGKLVGIYRHIARRPIFVAGNSDGDLQMLQYTTVPRGSDDTTPGFGLIVHHTDAEREWAYDRSSHIGTLDKALDEATARGWTVVDMKNEWRTIYPEG